MNCIRISILIFPLLFLEACSHSSTKVTTEATSYADREPASVRPKRREGEESSGQMLESQAIAAYRRGDYARAISLFEGAFLVEPELSETWSRSLLAYAYLAVGDYKNALALGEEMLRARPFDPLPYQQVGLAQLWLGNAKAALPHFQRALEFDSHAPRTHFYHGLTHAKLGDLKKRDEAFQDAEEEYRQVLKRNAKDFAASFELAALYLFWDRKIDEVPALLITAREGIGQAAEDEGSEKRLYSAYYLPVMEGILYFRKGAVADAQKVLLHALTELPSGARADRAEHYFYLAKTTQELGKPDEAKSLLDKMMQLDPNGPYALQAQAALKKK